MIRNYLRTALRTFSRNKIFSFINVLGLSIGISASLVLLLIVYHEFSFDRFEADRDHIFRVVAEIPAQGESQFSAAVPAPLGPAVSRELTGINLTVPLLQFQGDATATVFIKQADEKNREFKKQADIIFTNEDLFKLLAYEWLQGNPASVQDPFQVVLTESRAKQYFPGIPLSQVIGSQITYNKSLTTTVTGIVKDLHYNTFFTQKEFISFATISETGLQQDFMMENWNDWMAYSQVFIKTAEGTTPDNVETGINGLYDKYGKPGKNQNGRHLTFRLQPLNDVHFNYGSMGHRTANKPTLYGLLAVSAFLLILGCINFINLTTAQSAQRAKEIGIRKVIGSSRKQLMLQILSETFLITLISAGVAVIFTRFLLKIFEDLIPPGLTFNLLEQPEIPGFLLIVAIIVTILAGTYPAWVVSRFQPVAVLKSRMINAKGDKAWLRKLLTVFQFTIAQFFVIATCMVSKQISYTLNKDLGFRKEAIISFELPRDTSKTNRLVLLEKIRAIPQVQMASLGFLPPASDGAAYSEISYTSNNGDLKAPVHIRWGDTNYLKLYQVKILAGRNVFQSDTIREFLVNETYAKVMGFQQPAAAIGSLLNFNGKKIPVVGVIQDFHELSLHDPVEPVVFASFNDRSNFLHLALQPQVAGANTWQTAIGKAEQAFKSVYPTHDFSFSFFDENIASFYTAEKNTANLLSWATGMAVFISCLGLLGLVIYTTNTRQKEISIRKILGATVLTLVTNLSKNFALLVLIAFVLAAPVAWIAVNEWLAGFSYRTPMSWWVFAGSAVAMMLIALLTLSVQTLRVAMANPVKNLRAE